VCVCVSLGMRMKPAPPCPPRSSSLPLPPPSPPPPRQARLSQCSASLASAHDKAEATSARLHASEARVAELTARVAALQASLAAAEAAAEAARREAREAHAALASARSELDSARREAASEVQHLHTELEVCRLCWADLGVHVCMRGCVVVPAPLNAVVLPQCSFTLCVVRRADCVRLARWGGECVCVVWGWVGVGGGRPSPVRPPRSAVPTTQRCGSCGLA
jgi:hypothetical protein